MEEYKFSVVSCGTPPALAKYILLCLPSKTWCIIPVPKFSPHTLMMSNQALSPSTRPSTSTQSGEAQPSLYVPASPPYLISLIFAQGALAPRPLYLLQLWRLKMPTPPQSSSNGCWRRQREWLGFNRSLMKWGSIYRRTVTRGDYCWRSWSRGFVFIVSYL